MLKDSGKSVYAIARETGISGSHLYKILRGEESNLTIETLEGIAKAFGVTLTDIISDMPSIHRIEKFVEIPVVGRIRAGRPTIAEENVEGYCTIPADPLLKGKVFAVKVAGDSMSGVGIFDGDLVIIRSQPTAENMDIVLVCVDDDCFLRRFILADSTVVLEAANKDYHAIIVDETKKLEIKGVVLFSLKRFQ